MKTIGYGFFEAVKRILAKQSPDDVPLLVSGKEDFLGANMGSMVRGREVAIPANLRAVIETPGSGMVGKNVIADIPSVTDYLITVKAGARLIESQQDIVMPYSNVATSESKAETASAPEANLVFGTIAPSPKRKTAYVDVSQLVIMQGGPDAERYILSLLFASIASQLEADIFGKTAGSLIKAQGMFYRNTTGGFASGSVVPTSKNIIALEKAVDDNKALTNSPVYVTSGKGARLLKQTLRETNGERFLLERGILNDFPVLFSNNVSDTAGSDGAGSGLVFGDFSNLFIFQFGGYLVTIDQRALAGVVRITVSGFFDVKGARGTEVTGADPDDYAVAFSRMSIKNS